MCKEWVMKYQFLWHKIHKIIWPFRSWSAETISIVVPLTVPEVTVFVNIPTKPRNTVSLQVSNQTTKTSHCYLLFAFLVVRSISRHFPRRCSAPGRDLDNNRPQSAMREFPSGIAHGGHLSRRVLATTLTRACCVSRRRCIHSTTIRVIRLFTHIFDSLHDTIKTSKSQHSQECKNPYRHCFCFVTLTFDLLTRRRLFTYSTADKVRY